MSFPLEVSEVRVLLTAFGPFGGDDANASADALAVVAARWVGPVDLVTALLPVSFIGAPAALEAAIEESRPQAVLCLGEAGGRAALTPELWAAPTADARIPDNDGDQPRGRRLDGVEGPLRSRIDVDRVAAAIAAAGVPAAVSRDAGTFVCNATFRAALSKFDGPAGFLHVPAVRSVGLARVGGETDANAADARPHLTIEDVARGVRAAVLAVAEG